MAIGETRREVERVKGIETPPAYLAGSEGWGPAPKTVRIGFPLRAAGHGLGHRSGEVRRFEPQLRSHQSIYYVTYG